MFGFDFSIEIYVPAARRKFGYYVLPVLNGDRFIGRIDAALDRERQTLLLRGIHAEDHAGRRDGGAVARAVGELATFAGAKTVKPTGAVPAGWKRAFRSAL